MTDAPTSKIGAVWFLAAGALALTLVALAAGAGAVLHPHHNGFHPPPVPGNGNGSAQGGVVPPSARPSPGQRAQPAVHSHAAVGTWVVVVAILLAVAVAVVLGFLLASRSRRAHRESGERRRVEYQEAGAAGQREKLLADLDAARAEALAERDPRSAVLICWLRLERAAAKVGIARGPAETPAELAGRVLDGYAVDGRALDRLRQLYQAARYSSAATSEQAREEARQLLDEVRTGLARRIEAAQR